ncbi:MAG: hypothetical protein AAF970_09380 [Bacteroidota bacterium]
MPRAWLLLIFGFVLHPAGPAQGQTLGGSSPNVYGTGLGGTIALTNSGFGLGGYYQRAVGPTTSLVLELSITPGKDEREVTFFDLFGRRSIPNKFNYLLTLPLQVGWQRRLFQEDIEDNFRPYVQVSGGPVLGYRYPYFDDVDGDGQRTGEEPILDIFRSLPRGALEIGVSGALYLGAHFGLSRRVTQGLRIGYAVTYFPEGIQVLEPALRGPQRVFATPTLSLTFGRLFPPS